jgi:drug/metabolite transporter (DMT)-like permease
VHSPSYMRYLPIAAFLGLSLLWGSEWMLAASLPAQPRLRALALEYAMSAGLLLPIAIRRRLWRRPLQNLAHVLIVGIGILCLPQILIFASNEKLSPVLSLVALAAVPVVLAVSGRLAITAAVCGLAGVLFLEDAGLGFSMHAWPWLLLPLTAASVLALALAEAEKHSQKMSIIEALFGQCAVSGLLLFIASELLEHESITWSVTAGAGFVISAVLTTLGGYLLFYWLLGVSGAGRVSMLQWTQPLVATVESVALMSTRPGWALLAGAILIVIAVAWVFSNRDPGGGVLFEITQS